MSPNVDRALDRRSFLTSVFTGFGSERESLALTTGLEPYVPSAQAPWDHHRVGHLLRRTTFMPRWSEIEQLLALSPGAAVDLLLDSRSTPAPPSVADSETESLDGLLTSQQMEIRQKWSSDAAELRKWLSAVMRDSPLSIDEKLTLFWSGHFATEFVADLEYVIAPLLYRQNKLLRENGLGNLKDLVNGVTLDGAMLVYLGGDRNSKGKPNENYARELLELFTTGLGWYTEGDIKNAARVFTGWRVAQFSDKPFPNGKFSVYFSPPDHDVDAKIFLGTAFPALDTSTNTDHFVKLEVRKVIDTIFEKRPEAVARFISRKLYKFFVYSNPTRTDENVIGQMADLMIASNFEIRPVLRALLASAHFFDNANIGAQIKTPAEFMVGIARQLNGAVGMPGNMARMGQDLFDPPNVSGWPGHHDWITTSTFPVRAEVIQAAVQGITESDGIAFIKQFPSYTDVDMFVRHVGELLLPRPMASKRLSGLVEKLLDGQPKYEWGNMIAGSPSSAVRNLKGLLTSIVELPDFQLS